MQDLQETAGLWADTFLKRSLHLVKLPASDLQRRAETGLDDSAPDVVRRAAPFLIQP
jgi:hypothetical protein